MTMMRTNRIDRGMERPNTSPRFVVELELVSKPLATIVEDR